MAIYDHQLLPSAEGMATAMHPANLPENKCRLLEGMESSRLGITRPFPQPKRLMRLVPEISLETILGQAIWLSDTGTYDTLLIFTQRKLYTVRLWYQTGTTVAYQYDQIDAGQRSALRLGTVTTVADVSPGVSSVTSAQMGKVLVVSVGGFLYRYYRNETTGAELWYPLGMSAGGAPTVSSTGAGVLNGIYEYIWTWEDELGYESSPSDPLTTASLSSNSQTIARGSGSTPSAAVYWNLYRKNPGSTTYNFVAQILVATGTYADNNSDTTVSAGAVAPDFGENDPPDQATIMTVHRDRLILNDSSPNETTPTYVTVADAPVLATQSFGVLSGTYGYKWTWVNGLGQESGLSPAASIAVNGTTENGVRITRGTITVPPVSGSPIIGWNIYRLNPAAGTYRLLGLVDVTQTVTADYIADSVIAGRAPAPTSPTLVAAVAPTSVNNASIIQISNSNSPTQFSSISEPTSATDGLRLIVGGEGDPEVTGLMNIGDPLWIGKRYTWHLLFGSDITNWNLQQVGQGRGCHNPRSVQRAEHEIPFLSNDGFYSIQYNSGMLSPKLSWEIDDQLTGFMETRRKWEAYPWSAFVIPAVAGAGVGSPLSVEVAAADYTIVSSIYSRNRYYCSVVNKTFCFDMLTRGWSDTGWGLMRNPVLYKSQNPSVLAGGSPETVIFGMGSLYEGQLDLYYFTSADTPMDPDAFLFPERPYIAREITRNFAGDPAQERKKRGRRFTQFGKYGKTVRKGDHIGWIIPYADGRPCGKFKIRAGMNITRQGSLFQQEMKMNHVGEELYFEIIWLTADIELGNRLFEYLYLN